MASDWALHWSGSDLLGDSQRERHLETARALHHENGCSADDVITADGRVEDTDRVMYLRNHLTHLHRAASEGYPIKGYFLWSLLDNYEWADGYSKRFGHSLRRLQNPEAHS